MQVSRPWPAFPCALACITYLGEPQCKWSACELCFMPAGCMGLVVQDAETLHKLLPVLSRVRKTRMVFMLAKCTAT